MFNGMVRFEQQRHKYFHEVTGEEYKSVTTLLGLYEEHFPADEIAQNIARRDGRTKEDVLAEWKHINQVANDKGNYVHNLIEDYLKSNRLYIPKTPKERLVLQGYQRIDNYVEYGEEYYPEKIVWNEEYKIAGMSDLIIKIDDEYFDVLDHKGLPLNTPIFTTKGWKTMGTLTLEDKVFDSDGCQTEINVISDIKNKDCYQITFDNGEKITSDFEHRWLVSFLHNSKRKDVVMTTIELFDYMKKSPRGKKIPKIVCTKPLEIEETNLPIDPYVFGVWLGDLSKIGKGVSIEIKKRGYKINEFHEDEKNVLTDLESELNKLNLTNKHLPDLFLNSSYNQRLDIVRGFMDVNGIYDKKRKKFIVNTTKKYEVDVITMLVSSLGFKVTTIENSNNYITYFNSNINPFLVRNQDINIELKKNYSNHRNIISVTKVESEPTICIEVKSPKHTFLFGHSFIVTHNTNKKFNFYSPYGKHLLEPLNHLQDCQYSIYSLQLSIYAYLYEQISGMKCRRLMINYLADSERFLFKIIPVFYLKNDVQILLNHYKQNFIV